MKIIIRNNNSKKIKFMAENIIDGMKIGIIKEKLAKKGIPIELGISDPKEFAGQQDLDITFQQKDLIDLLC
jgi:hypothetical protein